MMGEMPGRVIGAVDEPAHRTEAVRRDGTDEMQAGDRALVMHRKTRRGRYPANPAHQCFIEKAESADVDLVSGRDYHVIGAQGLS